MLKFDLTKCTWCSNDVMAAMFCPSFKKRQPCGDPVYSSIPRTDCHSYANLLFCFRWKACQQITWVKAGIDQCQINLKTVFQISWQRSVPMVIDYLYQEGRSVRIFAYLISIQNLFSCNFHSFHFSDSEKEISRYKSQSRTYFECSLFSIETAQ